MIQERTLIAAHERVKSIGHAPTAGWPLGLYQGRTATPAFLSGVSGLLYAMVRINDNDPLYRYEIGLGADEPHEAGTPDPERFPR